MAKTEFPFIPLLESAALGGIDGVLASTDISAGRTALLKSHAVWGQAAMIAAGLIGEFMGVDADYTEPALGMGVGLLAREGAFKAAQSGKATPVAPQAYQAYIQAPNSDRMNQSAWRETTPTGISG
jgi:hypothetical protein